MTSDADIAIVGAGMAGASLAAAIGPRARVLMFEGEAQPGYHATGRSAAFWSESYGGPAVQPLTSASGPALAAGGHLRPRTCLHVGNAGSDAALDPLARELEGEGVAHHWLDRAALEEALPGVRPGYRRALVEPTTTDIDVGGLHAAFLAAARAAGARLVTHAPVRGLAREGGRWTIETGGGRYTATILVNAAGAWAGTIAALAGASPIAITPFRRTVAQIRTDPPASSTLPLVMDVGGRFYFKPEAGGRLWLSPHDEAEVVPHDVAPEELDVAEAIDRFEQVVDWHVTARERAWAGLRSFAPDRAPVYGFDARAPGFFWCAGQGGFGIQTAPAAAAMAAALLLGEPMPAFVAGIDAARYAPGRFD